MTSKYLKLSEAAELLSCSRQSLYSYVEQKVLPCLRIGRAIRFNESELIEFLKSGGLEREKAKKVKA